MKLKYFLTGLLISLLSISFSSATQIGSTTANQNQVLGFDLTNGQVGDFVGISWINYSSNNVFEITSQGNGNWIYNNGNPFNNIYQLAFLNGYSKGIFFWNNGRLVFHTNFNGTFNYSPTLEVQKFAKVSVTDVGNFTNYSFNYSLEDVLNSNNSFTHQIFAAKRGNDGSVVNDRLTGTSRIIYCIGDGTNYYCASCVPGDTYTNSSCNGGSSVIDLGLTKGSTIDDINSLLLNGYFPKKTQYYVSTGSCPTVGQLKSSSNLTPAVCYAGYDGDLIYTAGENTSILAGSGLNLFDTYALFSGGMTIQNWYDTYWTYYNNISFNPYPFYNKPKALLGLMVARQSAGLTHGYKGSYIILNYCYYVLNNISDSSSTCVGSSVSSQYPGITLTEQDYQDLIDSVNDDYTVHRPGSGSIFNKAPDGGGRSWGDDECNGIPCLFDKFYQMFTSSRINDVDFSEGGQGILPQYIALAFVVVVLFYVFKR